MSETAERFAFLPAGHNKNQPTHTHSDSFAFDEGMRNNATELFQEEKKACHSRRKDTLLDRPACVAKNFPSYAHHRRGLLLSVVVCRVVLQAPLCFPALCFPPALPYGPVLLFVILTPIYLRAAGSFSPALYLHRLLTGSAFRFLNHGRLSHSRTQRRCFASRTLPACFVPACTCVCVVSFCVRQRWQARKRTPGGKLCRNC